MKDSTIIGWMMPLLLIARAFELTEHQPIELTILFVGYFIVKALEDIKEK